MASVNRRTTTRGSRYDVRYRTPDGKVRTKTFATRKEADRFANTVEADKHRGAFVDPRLARSPSTNTPPSGSRRDPICGPAAGDLRVAASLAHQARER